MTKETPPTVGASHLSDGLGVNGYLADFNGDPVLASCVNCEHCRDQSDGPEYGSPWFACEKEGKEHMSNLKGFPFKTSQKCCELDVTFLIDWDEEHRKCAAEIFGDDA